MPQIFGTLVPAVGQVEPVVNTDGVKGSPKNVPDLLSRDAIVPERREEGMFCYVVSEATTYQLQGGIDNVNWEIFTGGGMAKPQAPVQIIPRVNADPTTAQMVEIPDTVVDVYLEGILNNSAGDTDCTMTIFVEERQYGNIVPYAVFSNMEVVTNKSFGRYIKPSPVGIGVRKVGARWDSTGGNSPNYELTMQVTL